MSRPSPDLDEFVRLVDIHVTPHMARLGYVRLHAFAGQQGASEAILTAVGTNGLLPSVLNSPGQKPLVPSRLSCAAWSRE